MQLIEDDEEQPAFSALSNLAFSGFDHSFSSIAYYLRNRTEEKLFYDCLARLIDPNKPGILRTKLEIVGRPGRPPKAIRFSDSGYAHQLVRLLATTERAATLTEIASSVSFGLQDDHLRKNLADLFEPNNESPYGLKFKVVHAGRGKRRSKRALEIKNFLELHADLLNEKTSDVIRAAIEEFHIDEETAKKYLKDRRRNRDPLVFEPEQYCTFLMRNQGHPEYQPLSLDKQATNVPS